MLLKLVATVALSITARKEMTTAGQHAWVYTDGAHKGWLCALGERDGSRYDVFLPALLAYTNPPAGMAPVPWVSYSTKAEGEAEIAKYCLTK